MILAFVLPILGTPGEPVSTRFVLKDQLGRSYYTPKAEFRWVSSGIRKSAGLMLSTLGLAEILPGLAIERYLSYPATHRPPSGASWREVCLLCGFRWPFLLGDCALVSEGGW